MQLKYLHYRAKDFANDAFFWSWVTEPNAESKTFWESFVKENPSKKKEIEQAREIVWQLNRMQYQLREEKVAHIWNKIRKSNPDLPDGDKKPVMLPVSEYNSSRLKNWYRIAAVLIGILLVAFAYLNIRQEQIHTVSTSFGQTREVLLPDSSEVIMNANTQISYKENWDESQREVWIQGEAFFSIRHLRHDKKFTVYANGVKVEVLGTEFTVSNRREKTQVVLNTGKVNLVIEEPEAAPREMVMKPGDLVEYSAADASLVHKVVNPDQYLSWTKNKLEFEEATLQDIMKVLEDNYGYTIQVGSDSILHKKFTGTVPADEINILLKGLSRTHNLNIRKKGSVITINSRDTSGIH